MRLCWQSYALWQLHWPRLEELEDFLNQDGQSMIKCLPRGLEHGDCCDPKPSSTEICCAAAQPATRLRRCESKSKPISTKPCAVSSNFAIFGCPKFAQLCSATFAETIARGKRHSGLACVACQAFNADSQQWGRIGCSNAVGRRMHLHAVAK